MRPWLHNSSGSTSWKVIPAGTRRFSSQQGSTLLYSNGSCHPWTALGVPSGAVTPAGTWCPMGAVPVHPSQSHPVIPSAPETASDSSWDHSEGLVVISVVVIALVVTSQPCHPFHVPLVPNTPLPFPQESFIRERGLFLTLWLFPSLFPQPVPIPAPDPIPCACSWWDSIPGSRWLLMAVTPPARSPSPGMATGGAAPSWS